MENNKRIQYIRDNYNIAEQTTTIKVVSVSYDFTPLLLFDEETGKEYLSKDALVKLANYDPTNKKIYTQWLVDIAFKYIKSSNHIALKRLIDEDGQLIFKSLKLFDHLKKTKLFKENASNISSITNIKDICNINQYYSIELLFDAVDPFIERDYSELVIKVKDAVKLNLGDIVYEDSKTIVYIAKTLAGSIIFHNYASWCTANPENTNFNSYRKNNRKPNGVISDILVFIHKEDLVLYQIHFETNQIHKASNSYDISGFVNVFLKDNRSLVLFLEDYLYKLVTMGVNLLMTHNISTDIDDKISKYGKQLLELGIVNKIMKFLYRKRKEVSLNGHKILDEIDLYSFDALEVLKLTNMELTKFPELPKKNNIQIISLYNNKISYLPDDIKPLLKVKSLNLKLNNFKSFDESISLLDPSNGGSLLHLCITGNPINEYVLTQLKSYLPNVNILN